ncbi:MAG: site-specific DNA-methyltransferase, partial [Gemmatimonadetes bacterium]|nr:site-specific DNA-methyltransferase [Gemmatimonadota bacterium]
TEAPTPAARGRRKKAVTKRKSKAAAKGKATQVLSYRHGDSRANNPEVGMVHPANDPEEPSTTWAYDPHLDPALQFDSGRAKIEALIDNALEGDDPAEMREALAELKRLQQPYLNWAGKAERTSFEVDTVSLHVHERVDPATILANVRRRMKGGEKAEDMLRQPDLFEVPFESLPLRQALDFYKHEKNWSNRLIAGDSLLVMNSLLQKESMAGQVQMIYIDPPYGIKYGSNFQPFTNKRDVKDGADVDLTQEPEMIKAFRDTWELGIHSYLTYLRDRLLLARELLSDSGSLFVQISEENVHHVRELLDEVFGPDNGLGLISYHTTSSQTSAYLASVGDYLLWYSRERKSVKFNRLYLEKSDDSGQYRYQNEDGRYFRLSDFTSQSGGTTTVFEHSHNGVSFSPTKGGYKTNAKGASILQKANRLSGGGSTLSYIRYLDDFLASTIDSTWTDTRISGFSDTKRYVVQTGDKVIERCLLMTTDPGDLVLDPTCGSGTSAVVAERWGRRWITCDTSRVAIALSKQRLMTASFDYYQLRYAHEGLKGGFVYKTVPHITLKSITNNAAPDIDDIYERMHPAVETALSDLNAALRAEPPEPLRPTQGYRKGKAVDFAKGDTLEEWEIPLDWPLDKDGQPLWPEAAKSPYDAFHLARQSMQRQMDDSITGHADQETLYDQPEVDKKRLRITGPFSVEAVPSPSVQSLDDSMPPVEADASIARGGETSRQSLWRNELMKTGLRGKGGQMMRVAELEAIPGLKHLHASGSLSESGERVVVSFGPEHAALEQR